MAENTIVVGIIDTGTPEMTSQAIISAHKNAGMVHRILVVFNGSEIDLSVEASFLVHSALLHVKNEGFTKACNEILDYDRTCDVVELNSDTLCEPNWLRSLHDAAYGYGEKVGMVAPRLDNKIVYRGHGDRRCGVTDSACDGTIAPHDSLFQGWFGFACVYFRRDMLNDQGYLNEKHRNYTSDKEYGRKISAAGYWIAHTHASVIHHIGLGSQSRKHVKFDDELIERLT